MGERALIGLRLKDGTIAARYCQWAHPMHGTGDYLLSYYKSEDSVQKLLERANFDRIGCTPEQCTICDDDSPVMIFPDKETMVDMSPWDMLEWWYLFEAGHWHICLNHCWVDLQNLMEHYYTDQNELMRERVKHDLEVLKKTILAQNAADKALYGDKNPISAMRGMFSSLVGKEDNPPDEDPCYPHTRKPDPVYETSSKGDRP